MKGVSGPANNERPRRFILHPFALALVCLAGCARYEYDLVEPPRLAGHIGTNSFLTARLDELEYRFVTSDDRLVVLVYNRGERLVKLPGPDSAAVDPGGESHPLQSSTLPPGAYVKRIFPPPRPTMQRTGPTIGV